MDQIKVDGPQSPRLETILPFRDPQLENISEHPDGHGQPSLRRTPESKLRSQARAHTVLTCRSAGPVAS